MAYDRTPFDDPSPELDFNLSPSSGPSDKIPEVDPQWVQAYRNAHPDYDYRGQTNANPSNQMIPNLSESAIPDGMIAPNYQPKSGQNGAWYGIGWNSRSGFRLFAGIGRFFRF